MLLGMPQSVAQVAPTSASVPGGTTVEVMLRLEGRSVSVEFIEAKGSSSSPEFVRALSIARARERRAQHDALDPRIAAMNGRVTGRFYRLVNALRVRIDRSNLEALWDLPGVVRIEPVRHVRRALTSSVPWVGAPPVWDTSLTALTGEGVRVGIIDAGIDYTHRSFGGSGSIAEYDGNDPTIIEPGSFPTAKVVGGFDFAGADYDSSGNLGSVIAVPDPDPIEYGGSVHGSHVAAIVGGFGVLQDGSTFHGPWDSPFNPSAFRVGPGVAPGALLYALKVFGDLRDGSSSLVPDALEWAADPNQDDDLSDRLDVVNGSVGFAFGEAIRDDAYLEAVDQLAALGCVVVFAVGNDANTHYIANRGSLSLSAIGVANSMDGEVLAIEVSAPETIAGLYEALEAEFTPRLADRDPITAPVVYFDPPDACAAPLNAEALNGSLAFIDRGGDCFFFHMKIRRAQQAGALGVIMVNNQPGPPILMGTGGGDVSDIEIPAVMISRADGAVLKSALESGVVATLDPGRFMLIPDRVDRLNPSSSRGPGGPDGRLKPDLAAPGTAVNSARAGSGDRAISLEGTSMAAPHVAGAAALLRKLRPDWPVEDLKAALMNTAMPIGTNGVLYPESMTGAGRLQVGASVKAEVIAKAADSPAGVSLSFGQLQVSQPYTTNREIQLVNRGVEQATFMISVSNNVTETGVSLEALLPEITVPAGEAVTVPVRFSADPARFDRSPDALTPATLDGFERHSLCEASGQVWFHGEPVNLHVPWHAVVQAASEFNVVADHIGLPGEPILTLHLPTRGESPHPASIVSAFQLGATSGNRGLSPAEARGDLIAVGAASDLAAVGSINQTTLYFGIAVAGPWFTPQRAYVNLEIEIDSDRNGFSDYLLLNGTGGHVTRGSLDRQNGNDAFLTIIEGPGGSLSSGGAWNVFAARRYDPAPYSSRVVVLSAPATAVGISSGQTRFRYRAAAYTTDWLRRDTSSWIEFDAAAPVIDPAPYGIDGTPLFADGQPVRIGVDRTRAEAEGFDAANPVRLLLLHHHNLPARQVDIVELDLSTADADFDGLPDVWELAALGDMDGDAATDRDGDGFRDADEHAAGTDPLDPSSLLAILPFSGQESPLRWLSVGGKSYAVERSPDPLGAFTVIQGGILATPGTNTFTDPELPAAGPYYYRVRLE
jgi:subtilisin family serine protease